MNTTLLASELRNVVVIESLPAKRARNTDGSEKRSDDQWKPFPTESGTPRRAKIDTKGGREFFQARSVNAELTHEITVRWQAGIESKMRVRFDDPLNATRRYFDIHAVVNPENQARYVLLLHCRELVGRSVTS